MLKMKYTISLKTPLFMKKIYIDCDTMKKNAKKIHQYYYMKTFQVFKKGSSDILHILVYTVKSNIFQNAYDRLKV